MSTFGQRLREERKRLGLTQRQAAAMCGISRESWGHYERRKSLPSIAAIELTGVDIHYVLTGSKAPHPITALTALHAAHLAINTAREQLNAVLAIVETAIKMAEGK